MKQRIVITGATGLIGSHLVRLLQGHYTLVLLTRHTDKQNNTPDIEYHEWNGKDLINGILNNSLAVINLLGENIGGKAWNPQQKERILTSRTDAAKAVAASILLCTHKPKVWIQASATGIYGQHKHTILDELSMEDTNSFLAQVCSQWEQPIMNIEESKLRKVILRTGVVLAPKSDLWKQLNLSFAFGIATVVGSGKQYLPWIHIADEVQAIVTTLENETYHETYNLVAPHAATMQEIIEAIKKQRKTLFTVHIPAWILNIVFGKEKTEQLVLTNQQVQPNRLVAQGFVFTYPTIEEAVANLRKKNGNL